MPRCPIAVIILTLNEEASLPNALASVCDWAEQVFVVDSFSADKTVEVAEQFGVVVHRREFESFASQRNWALRALPIQTDWICFLDADEYLPALTKDEIAKAIASCAPGVAAFYTTIQFLFLGRKLRYGGIYRDIIRLFRRGRGRYAATGGFREKVVIDGKVARLSHPIVHDDQKSMLDWVNDQLRRVAIDVEERLKPQRTTTDRPVVGGATKMEGGNSRWLRDAVYMNLPPWIRPMAQFTYRYLFRLGFLDGQPGFVYHFVLSFWYPLLVEAYYRERLIDRRKRPYDIKACTPPERRA